MKIVSFLIAFVIFSIVILFHELGHFLLAKANGIRVNEFCFGLGPTICGIQKGETKYCIKAFPFGGACMMEGEDEDSTDNRAFGKKPVWGRMSVVFAGPFFNFILAFIFAFILMSCVGYDKPVLSGVMEGYAAEKAGLQEGDEIIRMNHFSVHFSREITAYGTFHSGETIKVTYARDGQKHTTTLVPKLDKETGRYLYGFQTMGNVRVKGNVLTNLKNSFYEVRYWIYTTIQSLKMLVTRQVSPNELSGPVGIVKSIGDTYQQSVKNDGYYYALLNMLNWTILLSANLGVMNLLPLPALDGGRLLFLIIEAIRRKLPRYSEMSISIIMSAGIGLAGVLSGFVKNSANFNSFLFGSIVAISDAEMISVIVVSVVVLALFLLLYKELFYISLDERSARLAGVPVGIVNFIFTIMIAVTVSVAARTVGALMVSSMMVVPVACAMQLGKNFKQTVWYAVGLNVLFMIIGLFAAFYLGLKPGGTIVLVGVAALLIIFIGKRIVFGKQE